LTLGASQSLPATLRGTVVEGDKRGRVIGFPTANLRLEDQSMLPRLGVYAGRMLGRPAAVSVGVRPMFGEDLEPTVEAHVLDFDGDIYGRKVELELVAYLREEERFDSVESLVRQIELDVREVRRVIAVGG
jgi:riboflavin kinase / FMN adenylyltransferase